MSEITRIDEASIRMREMQLGRKLPRVERGGYRFACKAPTTGYEIRRSYPGEHGALISYRADGDQPSNKRGYITTYRTRETAAAAAADLNAAEIERTPDARYVSEEDIVSVLTGQEPLGGYFRAARTDSKSNDITVTSEKDQSTFSMNATEFLVRYPRVRFPSK